MFSSCQQKNHPQSVESISTGVFGKSTGISYARVYTVHSCFALLPPFDKPFSTPFLHFFLPVFSVASFMFFCAALPVSKEVGG